MILTDEQLEQAARELCKIRGMDPDEMVFHRVTSRVSSQSYRWVDYINEIKEWLQIQEAVNRVVGK